MKKNRYIEPTPSGVALALAGRWMFTEDKHDLNRWVASVKLKRLFVHLDQLEGHLTIEVSAFTSGATEYIDIGHGRRMLNYKSREIVRSAYRVQAFDLRASRLGWRWVVAQAIRECRRYHVRKHDRRMSAP